MLALLYLVQFMFVFDILLQNIPRFTEPNHPDDGCSRSTDACPDCIGCSNGECFERLREEEHAQKQGDSEPSARSRSGEALGLLQQQCPSDFEQPCEKQNDPRRKSVPL